MKRKQIVGTLAILFTLVIAFMGCTHEDNPLPDPPVPPVPPYEAADLGIGGIMYDKFWATESGFDQNDPNYQTINGNADFFRCKQCHAWDGLGNTGSYINRAPKTTRPNVSSLNLYQVAQNKTSDELFDAMKLSDNRRDISYDFSTYDPATNAAEGDKMPDYSQILSDEQIWDIVKYMKEGMFDVSELYTANYIGDYPTGLAIYNNIGLDGNADNGNAYYSANCASCHGDDGNAFLMGDVGVGGFLRAKPYEVQHKTKYGQLGSSMVGEFDISQDEMKDLYRALANTTNFPNPEPTGPPTYAADVQPYFNSKCIQCHNTEDVGAGTYPLNLEAAVSYNNLINDGFIDTASPSSSLLYTKIASGGTMSGFSTPAGNAAVLAWIEDGAKDN